MRYGTFLNIILMLIKIKIYWYDVNHNIDVLVNMMLIILWIFVLSLNKEKSSNEVHETRNKMMTCNTLVLSLGMYEIRLCKWCKYASIYS